MLHSLIVGTIVVEDMEEEKETKCLLSAETEVRMEEEVRIMNASFPESTKIAAEKL